MAKKAKKAKAKSGKKTKKRAVKKSAPSIMHIKEVSAVADLMPPGPFHFYVVARVQVPSPGYTASLKKAVPQGINPAILIFDVVIKKKPGIWPPKVTVIEARYDDKKYRGKYQQVTVRYGKESKTVKVQIVV
jgi:hypothetical protein